MSVAGAPDYRTMAAQFAIAQGVNQGVFVNQIQQESGFQTNVVSPAGAIGIAQFMPATAQGLGLNPYDPVASLKAAAQYDAKSLQTYGGDYQKMLAAYNAGGGAVDNAVKLYGSGWLAHMPTETQNYVKSIMNGTQPTGGVSSTNGTQTATTMLDTLKQWGEYAAIFLLALLLVIIGFFLLNSQLATQVAKKVIP